MEFADELPVGAMTIEFVSVGNCKGGATILLIRLIIVKYSDLSFSLSSSLKFLSLLKDFTSEASFVFDKLEISFFLDSYDFII